MFKKLLIACCLTLASTSAFAFNLEVQMFNLGWKIAALIPVEGEGPQIRKEVLEVVTAEDPEYGQWTYPYDRIQDYFNDNKTQKIDNLSLREALMLVEKLAAWPNEYAKLQAEIIKGQLDKLQSHIDGKESGSNEDININVWKQYIGKMIRKADFYWTLKSEFQQLTVEP